MKKTGVSRLVTIGVLGIAQCFTGEWSFAQKAAASGKGPAGAPPSLASAKQSPAQSQSQTRPRPRYRVDEVRPADPWRVRYELGPGDVLNFRIYGKPELSAEGVPVGPDGTISFLQARRVSVLGKTIPELVEEVERLLAEHHLDPKLIVTPAAVGSKRFTILGQVRANGTYPLIKPISLLEAIANSGGAEIGTRASSGEGRLSASEGEKVGLVDFDNSFVLRNGKMLDVDLGDLYLRGDITQNIQIEAGDYIYIASNLLNEIYVFGAVGGQGAIPFKHQLTVMGAITSAGGYDEAAWKKKILIVRGSLTAPVYLVVDTKEVLSGGATDVPLEPGDLVYVHNRPWKFGEELLDSAIQGLITGYAYRMAEELDD